MNSYNLESLYELLEANLLKLDVNGSRLIHKVFILSNGELGKKEVVAHYTNDIYPGEYVAFLQIAETPVNVMSGITEVMVFVTVIIACRHENDTPTARENLEYYNTTWKKALKFIGNLVTASEEVQENPGNDLKVVLEKELISPVGKIANVNLSGCVFDLNISFEGSTLLFDE